MWEHLLLAILIVDIYSMAEPVTSNCTGDIEFADYMVTDTTSVKIQLTNFRKFNDDVNGPYLLEYLHAKYEACDTGEENGYSSSIFVSDNGTADITALIPYSRYNITIFGKRCLWNTWFTTKSLDELTSSEKPEFSFTQTGEVAEIRLKWKCENLRGLLNYSVKLTCLSSWCQNEMIELETIETQTEVIGRFTAIGHTKYMIHLEYSRNNMTDSENYTFRAAPSAPGSIRNLTLYNANETTASIRWLPPFPPTGEIENYKVYSRGLDTFSFLYNKINPTCKIWKDFACLDIYIHNISFLALEVSVKNFNVSNFGPAAAINVSFRAKVPSQPLNPSSFWRNDSELIIKWQHPDQPYGPILKFLIGINDYTRTYDVDEEYLYYQISESNYHFSSEELLIYIIAVNAIGESEKVLHKVVSVIPESSTYLWILFLIPVVCLIIVGIIIVKKICFNKSMIPFKGSSEDILSAEANNSLNRTWSDDYLYDKVVLNEGKFSKLVKIEDYTNYIKNSIEQGEFEKQYEMVSKQPLQSQVYGNKLENKSKNRYSALIAYDETRVKLDLINGDPLSDYINANYIDGYNSKKTYIATQGPLENTIGDFWRMIWQEKVEYIIVAESLFEEGKRKFEKYWPELNGYLDYDGIRIVYDKVEVMVNYEIRHFNLTHDDDEISVQQYHFLSSPDHSRVSLYIHSLASFSRKVLSIPKQNAPIVVQCCDGIGRSGIVILSDICLRMSTKEGKIDVLHQLYKLRKQRSNMLDNVDQYKLVHFVLLRILQSIQIPSQTEIVCNKHMERKITNILTSKLSQQMKYLSDSSWQDQAMLSINLKSTHCRNNSKRIFGNTHQNGKEKLSKAPSYSLTNDPFMFINATAVDSYETPSRFMITAKPSTAAFGIFWQLVVEKQIKVIVCLNELTFLDQNIRKFNPLTNIEVQIIDYVINPHYEIYKLSICRDDDQKSVNGVNVLHLTNWQTASPHPENPDNLLKVHEEMNRLGKTSNTILVNCHDGIRASGLFTAMCFLIEKIKTDQVFDVCLAVRNVRQSKKEFVSTIEQLSFLYLCGLEYIRKFRTYANFNIESEM